MSKMTPLNELNNAPKRVILQSNDAPKGVK